MATLVLLNNLFVFYMYKIRAPPEKKAANEILFLVCIYFPLIERDLTWLTDIEKWKQQTKKSV
ncbi:MAG: hypothetical protein AB9861_08400 [Methanosarcina sp.]